MAATDLERLVVQLSADITKYEKSLARAQQAANQNFAGIERRAAQSTQRLNAQFSKIGLGNLNSLGKQAFAGFNQGVLSALAPVASLTAAIAGTKNALNELGKIADDVKTTGLKPELFQALGLAAKEAGVDQEALNSALQIFSKNVGLAQAGTGPLISGLKKLNPELLQAVLNAKDQNERFRLVSEALHNMSDATKRAALEATLFGKSGVKLGEVLSAGSKGLDEFIKKGHELGVIISDDMLANVDELSDKLDVVTFAIQQNLNQALVALAPLLITVAEGAKTFAQEIKGIVASIDAFSNNPSLETLGKIFQFRLIEGGLADQIRDQFSDASDEADQGVQDLRAKLALLKNLESAGIDVSIDIQKAEAALDALQQSGERTAATVKDDIKSVEDELQLLKNLAAAGADVHVSIEQAESNLKRLQDELIRVGEVAQRVGQQVTDAFASIAADPRAAGFAFQSQRDRENSAARDFFGQRGTEAGRSSSEIELAARTEQVLNEAKEKGIELTEEAARAEAERELKILDGVRAREDAEKDANKRIEDRNQLIRDTIASLQEETAQIQFETEHMADSNAEKERAAVVFETLNKLQREGIEITDELRQQVEAEAAARGRQVAAYDAAEAATEELKKKQEELAAQQEEVADAFKDSFKGFLSDLAHGASLTDALTSALGRLADRLIDIGLNGIFDSLGLGSASGGGLGGAASFQANTTLSQILGVGAGSTITGSGGSNTLAGLSKSVASGTSKGYRDAIASIESAGSGGYSALGPILKGGDRAFGRYQVMGANIGPWTEQALGQRMSSSQFLASPQAQDAVFDHVFGNYVKKYGPQGAANAWFTGSPTGMGKDVLGTSNTEYVSRFNAALGRTADSLGGVSEAGVAATKGLGDAASGLSNFGSILSSFMGSSMGGGSSWFQGLMSMFGGAGGAFNYMTSISPAATASILGAGGGFTGLYAGGTSAAPAGWAWVGEKGPELMRLRGGETILDHEKSMRLPKLSRYSSPNPGGGRTVNASVNISVVTPDAESFLESQNQIANRTVGAFSRAARTQ